MIDHTPYQDRDYGYDAQKAAERHLAALDERLHGAGNEADAPESAGPYCGCETCVIREVLFVAWPIIEEYVRSNPEPLS